MKRIILLCTFAILLIFLTECGVPVSVNKNSSGNANAAENYMKSSDVSRTPSSAGNCVSGLDGNADSIYADNPSGSAVAVPSENTDKALADTSLFSDSVPNRNSDIAGINVPAATAEPVYTTANKSREIIISMVPKSIDNPVFLDAKEAAEKVCKKLGVKFEWIGTYQSDANGQEMIIESLIRRRVDGIIVSCVDAGRMKDVIDAAVAAGIKVATFDADSPSSKRLFYCGTDNYAAGKACGNALLKELKKNGMHGAVYNILIMTADNISQNLKDRLKGFNEVVQAAGLNLNVVDTLYCRDDIAKAGDLLESYMANKSKREKIDIFFSTGGWPLVEPAESLPNFQKWCLEGGTSIVVDTYYPIIVAAKKGLADRLVGQNFKKMGELSILNMYKAITGDKVDGVFIDTGLELGDSSNFDKLLATKEPWEIK